MSVEQTRPDVRRGRTPLGLIGAVALVVVVECLIVGYKADVMDGTLESVDQAHAIAAGQVQDCGVLAFGDSMIQASVSPKVIRNRTGLRGFNLSLSGMQAPASYFLFRDALASGARPKFVLVDFWPELLTSSPWYNLIHWPGLGSYRDCLDLSWEARDPTLFATLVARKVMPSLRSREAIRSLVGETARGMGWQRRTSNRVYERFLHANRGFFGWKPMPDQNLPLDFWINFYFRSADFTAANRTFVDRFLDLAAAHGVRVCLVLPPYQPHLQAKVEEIGFHAKHDAWVRSLLGRYPGLDVLDARKSNYDRSVFRDVNHLAKDGAVVLSDDVGELLRRKLADPGSVPRWAALPDYRPRTVAVPYEEFETSLLLVTKPADKGPVAVLATKAQ